MIFGGGIQESDGQHCHLLKMAALHCSINTGGTSVNQMFQFKVTTTLQNVGEFDDVVVDIRKWIFYGIPNTSLRSEIDYFLRVARSENLINVSLSAMSARTYRTENLRLD